MSTNDTLLGITGATGRLGGRIISRLAATGANQRLLARDPSRLPASLAASAVRASFADSDAVVAGLTGVPTVLMVSASESADRVAQHVAFIDAAARAGVGHVVYISFFGAAPDATFTLARDHYATEEHLRASGMDFTFLRDNLYADFLPALVGDDGVIRGPAGRGRVAAVAQDDIADAAVAVLLDPVPHAGATYSLTGPEALDLDQIAAVLTESREFTQTRHAPVSYHPETVTEAYASRARYGAPGWQLDAWVSTYTAIAAGELAGVTDHVLGLTGHPATSIADVLRSAASAS